MVLGTAISLALTATGMLGFDSLRRWVRTAAIGPLLVGGAIGFVALVGHARAARRALLAQRRDLDGGSHRRRNRPARRLNVDARAERGSGRARHATDAGRSAAAGLLFPRPCSSRSPSSYPSAWGTARGSSRSASRCSSSGSARCSRCCHSCSGRRALSISPRRGRGAMPSASRACSGRRQSTRSSEPTRRARSPSSTRAQTHSRLSGRRDGGSPDDRSRSTTPLSSPPARPSSVSSRDSGPGRSSAAQSRRDPRMDVCAQDGGRVPVSLTVTAMRRGRQPIGLHRHGVRPHRTEGARAGAEATGGVHRDLVGERAGGHLRDGCAGRLRLRQRQVAGARRALDGRGAGDGWLTAIHPEDAGVHRERMERLHPRRDALRDRVPLPPARPIGRVDRGARSGTPGRARRGRRLPRDDARRDRAARRGGPARAAACPEPARCSTRRPTAS